MKLTVEIRPMEGSLRKSQMRPPRLRPLLHCPELRSSQPRSRVVSLATRPNNDALPSPGSIIIPLCTMPLSTVKNTIQYRRSLHTPAFSEPERALLITMCGLARSPSADGATGRTVRLNRTLAAFHANTQSCIGIQPWTTGC